MTELNGLMAFERRRLVALVAGNLELALAMHHADFELVTPRGVTLSRAAYLEELRSGGIRYLAWEPTSPMVGRVTGATGALRYRSRIEMEKNGHRLPSLPCWHTDYYERLDGDWQVVFSQATVIA